MNKETKYKIEILKNLLENQDFANIYYLQGNDESFDSVGYIDYWDILIFYFNDDHGNHRYILPVPFLPKRLKSELQNLAGQGKTYLASRNWFSRYQYERDIIAEKYLRPTSYYPPEFNDPFDNEEKP